MRRGARWAGAALLAAELLSCPGPRPSAVTGAPPPSCLFGGPFAWTSSGPLLGPVPGSAHDLVALKDPSVVRVGDRWHVFVSAAHRDGHFNIADIAFRDWAALGSPASATVSYLDDNPALAGNRAAPQVFFFTPQQKWYLVLQSGGPEYSTNDDIENPAGWSRPQRFFAEEPAVVTRNKGPGGWLDFWVICDAASCYLFFSDDNGTFYRSRTTLGRFPGGFEEPVVVMRDPSPTRLYEASNVYRVKGTGKYLALVEAFDREPGRYFRSFTADALDGAWTPLEDSFAAPFASTADVAFAGTPWTRDISHGELLRDGVDETLTVDPCGMRYLYQGVSPSAPRVPYDALPWRLGLLTRTN